MKRAVLILSVMAMATIAFASHSSGAALDAPGDPVKGQKIFDANKCPVCHKVNGAGGTLAPDLSGVGNRRDADWLAKFLVKPTTIDPKHPPKYKMPPVTVKGQDLDDLIAYLLSLKGKQ